MAAPDLNSDVAVADLAKPHVVSPDEFRELAQAQERHARQITLEKLANAHPVIADLIRERDELKAQVSKLADTSDKPGTTKARKA